MRIIAGIAKGMVLAVPRGDNVRPTSDRVREAIFSSLGARVVGADVLDLYAGTGALGLEAASRGARAVMLVEQARIAVDCIGKNLTVFEKQRGEKPPIEMVRSDVLSQLKRLAAQARQFTLIFADPPYGTDVTAALDFAQQHGLLKPDGIFVLERAKRDALLLPSGWQRDREAGYGDTRVSYLGLTVR